MIGYNRKEIGSTFHPETVVIWHQIILYQLIIRCIPKGGIHPTETSFICNDDCRCETCKRLEGKTVDLEDYFDKDRKIFIPPACDNCRCWIDTNTQI